MPIGKRNFRRNSTDVYDFILDLFWLVACVHCVKKYFHFYTRVTINLIDPSSISIDVIMCDMAEDKASKIIV